MYRQRQEEAVKQFDLTRQEELQNTLTYSRTQNQPVNNDLVSNPETQEQIDTQSIKK